MSNYEIIFRLKDGRVAFGYGNSETLTHINDFFCGREKPCEKNDFVSVPCVGFPPGEKKLHHFIHRSMISEVIIYPFDPDQDEV
jgi:hypothetical protein